MSLTLVEAAKLVQDPVQSAIIEMYARSTPLMMAIPFMDIQGNALKYNREETLPGIGFRGVNEAYTSSVGVLNPVTESLYIAGGDLDVDKFIVTTQGTQQRSVHEAMKVKALGLSISAKLINGNSATDPREFDGLKTRLTGNQLVEAGSTDGGDALSLAKLDELIDTVEGANKWLVMNKTLRRRLTTAARTYTVGGFITWDVDAFGRQIMKYNDIPILIADYDNVGSQVLPFTEVGSGGSTATATSIYCFSTEPGYLTGIQNGMIQATDLGELQDKPAYRTRVEWYMGLSVQHGKAAARLRGISNAAVVA